VRGIPPAQIAVFLWEYLQCNGRQRWLLKEWNFPAAVLSQLCDLNISEISDENLAKLHAAVIRTLADFEKLADFQIATHEAILDLLRHGNTLQTIGAQLRDQMPKLSGTSVGNLSRIASGERPARWPLYEAVQDLKGRLDEVLLDDQFSDAGLPGIEWIGLDKSSHIQLTGDDKSECMSTLARELVKRSLGKAHHPISLCGAPMGVFSLGADLVLLVRDSQRCQETDGLEIIKSFATKVAERCLGAAAEEMTTARQLSIRHGYGLPVSQKEDDAPTAKRKATTKRKPNSKPKPTAKRKPVKRKPTRRRKA
jgi:hypothetical protein